MYGANLDFSSVSLPGVGGSINPATAISSDALQEMNKTGKKWRTDKEGNMSFHNESLLKLNQLSREKRASLVNRDRDGHAGGQEAMSEIFGRKRARIAAFKEVKRQEYNFADDSELMSMPQPFSQSPEQSCSTSCKGPGKCSCHSCKRSALKDSEFREWTSKKRESLLKGNEKGEFAGPGMSFPIASPEDVSAAWSSVGRAANPRKIMANIIRIAKKFGWESGLPQTVKDRLKEGESGLPSPEFREWSSEKRNALGRGELKGGFAGPGMSFPIASPEDVSAAWSSVGRATDPDRVMREIIKIAKKNGWESGLPETVKQRLKSGGTGLPE